MPDDLIETIATVVILAAWGLRAVLKPLLKKQRESKPTSTPGARDERPEAGGRRPQPTAAEQVAPRPSQSDQSGRMQPTLAPAPMQRQEPTAPTGAGSRPVAEEAARDRTAELFRRLGLDLDEMTRPAQSAAAPASGRPASPPPPPPVPERAASRWDGKMPATLKAPPPLIVPDDSHTMLEAPASLGGEGPVPRRLRPAGGLAVEILDDLRGGASGLSRAMVLAEILGPPVALRPPDDSRG